MGDSKVWVRWTYVWGGRCLHKSGESKSYLGETICRLLEVVEVESWEELLGQPVRIKVEDEVIMALGNFLNDKWFSPEDI